MSIHNWNCSTVADPVEHIQKYGIRLSVQIGVHRYVADFLRQNGADVPASIVSCALVDTGCTRTAIDTSLAQQLNLAQIDEATVITAAGPNTVPIYAFSIGIADGLVLDCTSGTGCNISAHMPGIGALIGMDLLAKCIVILNGPAGHFAIAQ